MSSPGGRVRYRCAAAWIDDTVAADVDIVCTDGLITAIDRPDPTAPPDAGERTERLPGLVFPGFADAHSHIFHRALRGRTHAGDQRGGSFWTWRTAMYELAGALDPESLATLAVAGYAELVCAGYTAVGEFHYLHHGQGGRRYQDPNAMGLALISAAEHAGISLTLLDTVYLAGGFGVPITGVQQRFSDGSVGVWADRVAALPSEARVGAAVHSVRAVAPDQLPQVAAVLDGHVLHVHLSEQPAENADCLAATGLSPTALLHRAGLLGPRTAAVHATHLDDEDVRLIAGSGATVVLCPTTEADLADGLPRTGELTGSGVPLACGGDQQVIVDPFAQARGIEYGQRLASGRRGRLPPEDLVRAATVGSHRAIDSPAGRIAVGAPADLVAVRTDSARTAGCEPGQLVMVASAADVAVVVIGGQVQARGGIHQRLGDPGEMLAAAIRRAWR